jgi:hypothetical protein
MKKLGYFSIILLFMFSCKSAEKLLQQGYYDAALEKSIKKVQKGNASDKEKEILDKSYRFANGQDQTRIDFLLEENRPENWDEIFSRYSAMSARQTRVQRVVPFTINGKKINYPVVDYNARIIEAKTNAAEHSYTKGVSLMELGTKEAYREAFYDFQKVKNYRASDYKDLEILINDARYYGTSRVLIEVENRIPFRLPADFFRMVQSINTAVLDGNWVEYHLVPMDRDTYYDYYVNIVLNHVQVDPPKTETREYVRTKRVEDGTQPRRDERGNLIKDSEGKTINDTKYKDLECRVIETKQLKAATVSGEINIMSANPDRLIRKFPVGGTSVFEVISAKAVGDREALLPEDWEIINRDEVRFPPDIDLIMDCAPILRDAITDVLRNNRDAIY